MERIWQGKISVPFGERVGVLYEEGGQIYSFATADTNFFMGAGFVLIDDKLKNRPLNDDEVQKFKEKYSQKGLVLNAL